MAACRWGACRGQVGEETKGHKETFGGIGYVHYCEGFVGVHMSKQNFVLQIHGICSLVIPQLCCFKKFC